jgi:hypothetical protein
MLKTLDDFTQPDPDQEHSVRIGDICRNWRTAMMVALETVGKYGHAVITSNGSPEKPATHWEIRRCIY